MSRCVVLLNICLWCLGADWLHPIVFGFREVVGWAQLLAKVLWWYNSTSSRLYFDCQTTHLLQDNISRAYATSVIMLLPCAHDTMFDTWCVVSGALCGLCDVCVAGR